MRKTMLVGVMLIFGTFGVAQEATKPTLEETTNWIQTTLASHGNCVESTPKALSEKVESLQFDGCVLKAEVSYLLVSSSPITMSGSSSATLRLSDIKNIEIKKVDSHWQIALSCKENTVKGEKTFRMNGSGKREQFVDSQFQLPCDDEQITNRVKTALLHAVELCGKQKEPF